MDSKLNDVIEFQKKFGNHEPQAPMPVELHIVRLDKLEEEIRETIDGLYRVLGSSNLIELHNGLCEVLDGTVDAIYVLYGTLYCLNLHEQFDEAWRRVHKANMTKERKGEDVVKPVGFTPPVIGDLVARTLPICHPKENREKTNNS
jgi:hypothetical protein